MVRYRGFIKQTHLVCKMSGSPTLYAWFSNSHSRKQIKPFCSRIKVICHISLLLLKDSPLNKQERLLLILDAFHLAGSPLPLEMCQGRICMRVARQKQQLLSRRSFWSTLPMCCAISRTKGSISQGRTA